MKNKTGTADHASGVITERTQLSQQPTRRGVRTKRYRRRIPEVATAKKTTLSSKKSVTRLRELVQVRNKPLRDLTGEALRIYFRDLASRLFRE